MSSQTQAFADEFRATVGEIARRLEQIREQESMVPVEPGKWTPKQIIGHLIDSAANNHLRFVQAQFTDDLVFSGYQQDDWVTVQGYNDESWVHLVSLWKSYNLHLAHVISRIPETISEMPRAKHNLDRIAFRSVAQDQPATLDYFIRDYLDHLRHHIKQILS